MRINVLVGKLSESIKHYLLPVCVIAIAIPIILCLLYIIIFGFNVMYWDIWEFIPLFQDYSTGHLTFNELFSLHNEHRIFFPRLIFLLDAIVFHFQPKDIAYLSWLLLVVILYMLYNVFMANNGDNKYALMEFVPIAFMLFTLSQWESILFGLDICGYLPIFCFISAIYLLNKTDDANHYFLLALALGIVSSFSYLSGLLVWPLGLLFLAISKAKNRLKLGGCWSLAGILAISAYSYGFQFSPAHPPVMYSIYHGVDAIKYFLVNLSVFLTHNVDEGLVLGAILLIMLVVTFVLVVKNSLVKEYSMWITFILFSVGCSVMLVIGRSGFGVDQALSSRYVMFTIYAIIGLYAILVSIINKKTFDPKERGIVKVMFGVLSLILAYGIISGYVYGLQMGEAIRQQDIQDRYILLNHQNMSDDQLKNLYPVPDTLREMIKIAEQFKLNVFYR